MTTDAAADPGPAADASPLPLRVLIVDDEPLARLRLRQLLAQTPHPATQVLAEAADADQAEAALRAAPDTDLVLLDIALPGTSGLQIARALRALPHPPAVVFVTAHGGHALDAFELEALDYLTKPVRRERLQAALERALRRRGEARPGPVPDAGPVLVVHDRGRVLRLPVAELLYLKAEQKYVTVVARSGQWLLDDALSDLEQRLGDAVVRVHRNALVALAAVRALERVPAATDEPDAGEHWAVRLSNGEALAVSRRQLAAVREAFAPRG